MSRLNELTRALLLAAVCASAHALHSSSSGVGAPLSTHGGGRCTDDAACNLNGACSAGTCACVAPWTGTDCGLLDFLPARAPDGALYRREGVSSWCASTLRDDAGVWHAVVAQMADNCGLNSWETNSQLVHVTSTSGPAGPYANETLIRLPFSHNPKLSRAPDGTFLIWHIGCGDNTTHRMGNCSGGVSPPPPPPPSVSLRVGDACMVPLNSTFPQWESPFGGMSPLSLGPCMGAAAQWRLTGDTRVTSAAWLASLNIDCDSCTAGSVAKLMAQRTDGAGKATGGLAFSSVGGGQLQVAGCAGMCLSNGGAGARKPCGSAAEPWTSTQLHVVPCASADAGGWSVEPAAREGADEPAAREGADCGISYTELLSAPSLDGPWSFETAFQPNASGNHPFFPASVDNPAPFFYPNGSVGVMFRSYTRASAEFHSVIGIARADDWRGPWTLPTEPIFAGLEEDPFWFYQPATNSYHALFHSMGGCSNVGCHAFSRDSITWTLSTTPAYNFTISFTDGTKTTFSRRERPQLVFDPETGAPTHLINGIQLPRADQPANSQGDYTYSVIVPLRI